MTSIQIGIVQNKDIHQNIPNILSIRICINRTSQLAIFEIFSSMATGVMFKISVQKSRRVKSNSIIIK